jgi:hypothetical protein
MCIGLGYGVYTYVMACLSSAVALPLGASWAFARGSASGCPRAGPFEMTLAMPSLAALIKCSR